MEPNSLQAAWRTRLLDCVPFITSDASKQRAVTVRSRDERTLSAVGKPYPIPCWPTVMVSSSRDFSKNAEILLSRPRGGVRSALSPKGKDVLPGSS